MLRSACERGLTHHDNDAVYNYEQGWMLDSGGGLRRILVECLNAWRQLHPGMTATVINRNLWRRKIRVSECSYGHAHGLRIAIFRVKQGGPANGAEPEDEPGTLIANARVLGRSTMNFVGCGESGKRSEHAAGSALAGQAMAYADASRLTFYFDS
jgi:hypothetical protein